MRQSTENTMSLRFCCNQEPPRSDTFHTFKLILAPKFLSIIHKDSTKTMKAFQHPTLTFALIRSSAYRISISSPLDYFCFGFINGPWCVRQRQIDRRKVRRLWNWDSPPTKPSTCVVSGSFVRKHSIQCPPKVFKLSKVISVLFLLTVGKILWAR
jgi:hypothetical protein